MAVVYASRLADTSQTTGAGPIGVTGRAPRANLRTFSDVCLIGDEVRYLAIVNRDAAEWEEGTYVYTGVDQLTARQIYASSNGGAKVNWSWGTKDIYATVPARVLELLDQTAVDVAGTLRQPLTVVESNDPLVVPTADDNGKLFRLTLNATLVGFSLPASLPLGWLCRVEQAGTGTVVLVPESGSQILGTADAITRQYGVAYVYVAQISGGVTYYNAIGDVS